MSERHTFTFLGRSAAMLLAAILLAGSVRAESGWSRLAQIMSPKAATDKAQANSDAAKAAQNADMPQPAGAKAVASAPAPAAGVPVASVPEEGQQIASVAPPSPIALPQTTQDGDLNDFGAGGSLDANGAPKLNLGLESEDDGSANLAMNLSKDPEVLRLMGDNPRFRYNPGGRQDPMLMPWVRNAAIFEELNAQADELVKAHNLDKAAAVYQKILDMKDLRYQGVTMAKLQTLINMKNEQAKAVMEAQGTAIEVPVELPSWVTDNTTAVLISKGQQLCMVGDHMLAVGDSVPDYPDVHVASISDDKVMYQIKSKTFEVPLTSR